MRCPPADMVLQFIYGPQDFISDISWTGRGGPYGAPLASRFDSVLQAGWTDRMDRGLFRYHLGDLQTRVLPGPRGLVAQLNVLRGTERRKPQEILSIQQEFSAQQFNFNKINPEEVIMEMEREARPGAAPPLRTVVIINVSPLEFGHCLFVPEPGLCSPQVLTEQAVQMGMEALLLSSDASFRVGFNSLGGFASVNHLHLHGYYLAHQLEVESAPARPLVPDGGLYVLDDPPACFLFYAEADDVEKVAKAVCGVTDLLVSANVAHNLFMTRGSPPCGRPLRRGVRAALWPRTSCFGAKEETAFNVALCELAGHLPFKNKQDYEEATEDRAMEIIQKFLLPREDFDKLERQIVTHLRSLS